MARHIRLKKDWQNDKRTLHFTKGNVIGVHAKLAAQLVANGTAEYVADDVRTLRYPDNTPVQTECFAPVKNGPVEETPEVVEEKPQAKKSFFTKPSGDK